MQDVPWSWYTGRLLILRAKISGKGRITFLHLRLRSPKIISLKIGRLTVHYMQDRYPVGFYHSFEDTFNI